MDRQGRAGNKIRPLDGPTDWVNSMANWERNRLPSDDDLASGGKGQYFWQISVASGYPGQDFLFYEPSLPVIVYSPISNLELRDDVYDRIVSQVAFSQ